MQTRRGLSEGARPAISPTSASCSSMSMKTSARQPVRWHGGGAARRAGRFRSAPQARLRRARSPPVITHDSAATLGLAIGSEPHRAGQVVRSVLVLADPQLRISARNQLWRDQRIHCGTVNAEVSIALPGGRSVCGDHPGKRRQPRLLAMGGRACAAFKASSVILCQYL